MLELLSKGEGVVVCDTCTMQKLNQNCFYKDLLFESNCQSFPTL